MNFIARASGYMEAGRGTRVNGTNTLDFMLTPVPPAAPAITITSRIVSGGPGTAIQEWAFVATGTVPFTSYDWSFGDGGAASGSGAEEQHVYSTKGTFTVTVIGKRSNAQPVTGTLVIEVT